MEGFCSWEFILGRGLTSENGEEQVDDIKIETDSSRNFLLNMVMSHNELGIHQDVAREYQCSNARVYQLNLAVTWEEHGHETKENQCPQSSKEVWHP